MGRRGEGEFFAGVAVAFDPFENFRRRVDFRGGVAKKFEDFGPAVGTEFVDFAEAGGGIG